MSFDIGRWSIDQFSIFVPPDDRFWSPFGFAIESDGFIFRNDHVRRVLSDPWWSELACKEKKGDMNSLQYTNSGNIQMKASKFIK